MTLASDPITLELYRHRFAGIAEEMGEALRRTGYSPNIKERLDYSCALFDSNGRLVAQAAHIPVHLGAMPESVAAARAAVAEWQPGDIVILNDPFQGGTHLPDITLVAPVFLPGVAEPAFFVANRAHHADIGGMSPGSLPLSSEIFQEGLIIPPLKLAEAGRLNESLVQLILRNVRTPEERRGDLEAQIAACRLGERRVTELADSLGNEEVLAYTGHLLSYSERRARAAIASWPDGVFEAEDQLEIEGSEAFIRVRTTIEGENIHFDFTGTSSQLPDSSLNAVGSIARSACYYVVLCLLGDVPANGGAFAPVEVLAPEGTLVNARPPAAVAGGNVETSQRIVDVVLRSLAPALPGQIPASSQGTMNNLTIGGLRPDGTPFTYYETIGGGGGASAQGDGLSGAQVHMTNTLNTPVEALERAFPLRIRRYALRANSGGSGTHHGGDGLVREYEFLAPATVTMLSERRSLAPAGLAGGEDGEVGRNVLIAPDGAETLLSAKFNRQFQAGECLRVETPGGGGFGLHDSCAMTFGEEK